MTQAGPTSSLSAVKKMPNLQELIVPTERMFAWLIYAPHPPGVIHHSIKIFGVTGHQAHSALPRILKRGLGLGWPALRCFRIMPHNPNSQPDWKEVSKFEHKYKEAGIAVEDAYGRSLFQPETKGEGPQLGSFVA